MVCHVLPKVLKWKRMKVNLVIGSIQHVLVLRGLNDVGVPGYVGAAKNCKENFDSSLFEYYFKCSVCGKE
jgi:hypothetical protein